MSKAAPNAPTGAKAVTGGPLAGPLGRMRKALSLPDDATLDAIVTVVEADQVDWADYKTQVFADRAASDQRRAQLTAAMELTGEHSWQELADRALSLTSAWRCLLDEQTRMQSLLCTVLGYEGAALPLAANLERLCDDYATASRVAEDRKAALAGIQGFHDDEIADLWETNRLLTKQRDDCREQIGVSERHRLATIADREAALNERDDFREQVRVLSSTVRAPDETPERRALKALLKAAVYAGDPEVLGDILRDLLGLGT